MHNLQVEEFESRQLLNGSGFYLGPLLSQPFAVELVGSMVSEHSRLVESEAPAVSVGWGRYGEGVVKTELQSWRSLEITLQLSTAPQSWTVLELWTTPQLWTAPELWTTLQQGNFSHPGFDSRGLEDLGSGLRGLDHPSYAFARLATGASAAPGTGAEPPSAVPVASSLFDARVNPGSRALTAPVSSGSTSLTNGAAAEALFAMTVDRSNLLPRPVVENPFGGHGLPALSLSTLLPPSTVTPVKEPDSGTATDPGEQSRTGSNQAILPAIPEIGLGRVLRSPLVADALPALPSLNLSALEVGIQQFLNGLERLGPRMIRREGTAAWWPWIVALVAAATACEITRRELRRLAWTTDNGEWSPTRFFALGAPRDKPENEDRA